MSALGQTFKATKVMSALPLKPDFCSALVLLWAKSGDCLATLEPSHYHWTSLTPVHYIPPCGTVANAQRLIWQWAASGYYPMLRRFRYRRPWKGCSTTARLPKRVQE